MNFLIVDKDRVDLFVRFWNKYADKYGFVKCRKLTAERRILVNNILDEFSTNDLKVAIKMLRQSEHLVDRKWFTFDFLIRNSTNFSKFIEGNYSNRTIGRNRTYTGGSAIKSNTYEEF